MKKSYLTLAGILLILYFLSTSCVEREHLKAKRIDTLMTYCYKNGLLYPLTENIQTNWSSAYLQDNNCNILFDQDGNALSPQFSEIDIDRIKGGKKSIYLNSNNPFHGFEGYCCDGMWYFDYEIGARYGLNTETANANPTFSIDKKGGKKRIAADSPANPN